MTTDHEWKLEGVGDRSDILAYYEQIQSTGNPAFLSMPYSNLNQEKQPRLFWRLYGRKTRKVSLLHS
jgi:hypothetical protein